MKRATLFLLVYLIGICFETNALGKILEEHQRFNVMHVDDENTLWLASNAGLYEWKNHTVQRIPLSSSIHITSILSIGENLILGCFDGKIYTYCTSQKQLKEIGNLGSEISMMKYENQHIYICTKGNGFIEISPTGFHHFNLKNGLTDNFIYQLSIIQGKIWTATDKGFQITSSPLETHPYQFNAKIPDQLITSFDYKFPFIYCGTQQGDICKIDTRNDSIEILNSSVWNSSQINHLKILDRSIAIATESGAYLIDSAGNLNDVIVASKPASYILTDMEANLYVCGDHLFATSLGEQLAVLKSIDGINTANTHSMLVDSQSNLYFTPDEGLVKYNLIQNKTIRSSSIGIQDNVDITSLFLDHNGKLWVGTSGKGLFLVDTSTMKFKAIPIDSSLETSGILSITGDENTIWVSSLNGVWYSSLNQPMYDFKSLEDEYQQKKFYAYQVCKDKQQNLWLATDGQGILKISKGKISNFSNDHHIISTVFYGVKEDAIGQLWFNAYNEGLYCLKQDSMIHLNQSNGLSSNEIVSVIPFQNDYIVAGSSHGIDIINIHTLSVSHIDLELMHIAQFPETNSIANQQNQQIYLGTNIGILNFYLPSYKTHFLPQAHIKDISVMEKCCAKSIHRFNSDENYFRFTIGANHNSNQTIFFRYKLKGFNEKWSHTIDKEVVFPRLNPGKYEFILECANNKNFFNSTYDNYIFEIENPFYRKSWFILLLLIGFAIIFYYYVRFREKRISRVEQLEKEKVIAEFETLKHQVSPHFLFNSFNTLIQVIDEDKEQAIEYTQMLSDYYRSLLSYRNVDLVTFTEELILLDKYIYLQKMRFGDALEFENLCKDEPTSDIQIPPLTLQLLAENAIKHNSVSSSKPLHITIQIKNNKIEIINNLNEKISAEVGENIGLQNIKNRFKLFTRSNVEIKKTETEFIVSLPILTT